MDIALMHIGGCIYYGWRRSVGGVPLAGGLGRGGNRLRVRGGSCWLFSIVAPVQLQPPRRAHLVTAIQSGRRPSHHASNSHPVIIFTIRGVTHQEAFQTPAIFSQPVITKTNINVTKIQEENNFQSLFWAALLVRSVASDLPMNNTNRHDS